MADVSRPIAFAGIELRRLVRAGAGLMFILAPLA
jgi:hypothetical protein